MRRHLIILFLFIYTSSSFAQSYTHQDSLLGWLNVYRGCYDVISYDIILQLDFDTKRIAASNRFFFKATEGFQTLQFELSNQLKIAKITYHGQTLKPSRDGDAVFITFPKKIVANAQDSFRVFYTGMPIEAKNPPWEGGLVWAKDSSKKHWIGVACQNIGAQVWLPVKGHLSDEPDSVDMHITVPSGYMAVSNGDLKHSYLKGENMEYHWHTSYPINNYDITFNIGDYTHVTDYYQNASGKHQLDYYVNWRHANKVRSFLIPQTKKMFECFEQYFGEYPFWKEGYALVEAPFWGMEHQGAIAYNNGFQSNEFGFDFILVHETGHEWFGNSLSMTDRCDMWIHESFTTYAEAIYVEHYQGKQAAIQYLLTQAKRIENKQSMISACNSANYDLTDIDIYFKGTWMLHTLRSMVNDDNLWWKTIKSFTETFKYRSVTTEDVIRYFNRELGKDYTWFFNHYLKTTDLPQWEYRLSHKKGKTNWTLQHRWVTTDKAFAMPLEMETVGGLAWRKTLYSTTEWQTEEITGQGNINALKSTLNPILFSLKQLSTTEVASEVAKTETISVNPTETTKPKKERKKKRNKKAQESENEEESEE